MTDVDAVISKAAEKFGVSELREKQYEAVRAFLCGNDVFLTVPTGYGKSIVYGILPFAFDIMKGVSGSILVCISPLTAIMLDQAKKFTSMGLSVGYVGEGQLDPSVSEDVLKGKHQLVLISPENIVNDTPYRSMLLTQTYRNKIIGLAVDEAHCIQLWGTKFRLSFARLGELRSLLPSGINVIALTATATQDTLDSVKLRLTMPSPVVIGLPPHRANIFYSVVPYMDIFKLCNYLMGHIIEHYPNVPKVVVFSGLDSGSQLNKFLRLRVQKKYGSIEQHIVDMFNKASSIRKREEVLESFCQPDGKLRIVIASTSFGMGVNCPNIRKVIHWGPPEDLDTYLQETGRAGRDGQNSSACLLYGHPGGYVTESMRLYGQNSTVCRRELMYKKFLFFDDSFYEEQKCKCCDICKCICECQTCNEI